jgi:hypothetical protein
MAYLRSGFASGNCSTEKHFNLEMVVDVSGRQRGNRDSGLLSLTGIKPGTAQACVRGYGLTDPMGWQRCEVCAFATSVLVTLAV